MIAAKYQCWWRGTINERWVRLPETSVMDRNNPAMGEIRGCRGELSLEPPDETDDIDCLHCGGEGSCQHCGRAVEPEPLVCAECGEEFCPLTERHRVEWVGATCYCEECVADQQRKVG